MSNNNQRRRTVWLRCLLAVIGAVLWIRPLSAAAQTADAPLPLDEDLLSTYRYDDRGRPDPFVPFWLRVAEISEEERNEQRMNELLTRITVNGVLWEERRPLAMINGKIYEQGDEVEGLTVARIADNVVVLAYKGLERTFAIIVFDAEAQGGTNDN